MEQVFGSAFRGSQVKVKGFALTSRRRKAKEIPLAGAAGDVFTVQHRRMDNAGEGKRKAPREGALVVTSIIE